MAFNLFQPSSEAELILSWILNKNTIYNCFCKQWESLLKPNENATVCALLHRSINEWIVQHPRSPEPRQNEHISAFITSLGAGCR